MKKLFMAAIAIITLSGCAAISEQVVSAVDKYCTEPLSSRYAYRATVNAQLKTKGHSIVVTCSGDPEQ